MVSRMRILDRKLLRELLQMRGQALAIALVVACGIAALVTAMSAYNSLKLSRATYYDRYRFAQVFAQLKRAPQTLASRIDLIPGVARSHTRVVVEVTLDVPGLTEPAVGRMVSIPEHRMPMLNDLFVRRGRYITRGARHEVLVSEPFAEANRLDIGDYLGAVINGRWQRLVIVGIALSPEYIYAIPSTGSLVPDNKRFGILWMGRKALATAFDMDAAFNDVTLSFMPDANEAEVIAQLDRLLTPYGGLGAYGRDRQISARFLADELTQLQVQATTVPSVFLGIAAFLLHIVLSRLIRTQREVIAVLKAFGYSNAAIGWHYVKLVLTIVLLGAALGIALGLWFGSAMTAMYARFYRFPLLRYEAGWALLAAALLVSCGAAILGALGAVRQAVTLPPAEAMRPEPPARFRPTLIERLGLGRLLSPVGRMIVRNLERKPIQALLSMLGIALAVAILIFGRYFQDAIDHVLAVQFRHVQQEDVSLVFRQPLSARARHDVANLPGVLRVEPFRSVAARLRFGHRTYRGALTGLEPHGQLRRLIDRHLRVLELPPEGVVLTSKLAELLGVVPGDTLTVEVLEGARPVRYVAVVGLIDELLGVSAYMDIRALHRLLREGETVSGAFLAVDPQYEQQLYAQLKRTPAVAGVSLRRAALASFEETIGTNFSIFITVLVIFACTIAFGVVYNTARIALAERGRELASLRVIGFTQAEVALILFGEQAILMLVAIPLGFAPGYGFSALMSLVETELFRMPLIVSSSTYVFACIVVSLAAVLSGLVVRRQLARLDLIAVLKTKE